MKRKPHIEPKHPASGLLDGAYWHRAYGEHVWRLIEIVDQIAWPRWEGSAMYRPLSAIGDVVGPLVRPQ